MKKVIAPELRYEMTKYLDNNRTRLLKEQPTSAALIKELGNKFSIKLNSSDVSRLKRAASLSWTSQTAANTGGIGAWHARCSKIEQVVFDLSKQVERLSKQIDEMTPAPF